MNLPIRHLTLRPLTLEDAPSFFELIDRNRLRLQDFFPQTIAAITTPDECTGFVSKKMEEAIQRDTFSFVLTDADAQLHGYMSVKNIDSSVPKCELAYFIDAALEGRGIMSRAMAAILNYCFHTLQMNKVYLVTAMNNLPSRRIAEKNGFKLEGVLRNNFKLASGALTDMAYYGMLKKEEY